MCERPPCDAEIIGRDGAPMSFRCNLPAGHLGGCAELADIRPLLRKLQDDCDRISGQPTPPASEPPRDSADSGKVRE